MNISGEGKSLIKKFEGCKLESYKCSGGVWTCGWGSTKDCLVYTSPLCNTNSMP